MKDKIKNFLLKIKKSLCTEIKSPVYKIILFGIIMFIISSICFGCSYYSNEKLNEMKTEQIVETPQTELNIIDRDIRNANPTSSDYINPNNTYNVIYCNNTLDNVTIFNDLYTFYNLYSNYFIPYGDAFVYPFYAYYEYDDTNPYCICFIFEQLPHSFQISISTINLDTFNVYRFWYYSISSDSSISDAVPLPSFILPSMVMATITPFSSFVLSGTNIPIGVFNQVLYSNFSSKQFETISTPTLENAPSSLVNTIPSNALTTLPTNLGTKVYDSGSAVALDPNNSNEYDAFGYQIYYKSSILTNETDLLRFTLDGITYDVEPNIYRYYLTDVYVVIYTLWNNTPIYYVSDNILLRNMPFTLDYETRFGFNNLNNLFNVRVDIVETYSDYIHIRFSYDYYMFFNHVNEVNWLIDEESVSFDALLFSSVDKPSVIKNDGFMLNVIPELDPKFAKMGQTQTNNMYSTIVHGGVINSVYSNGYHKGVGVGETIGYTEGYSDGVETGKSLQNPLNPIMDFIADGALVISNVFSFEILPNLSLGTMLLFPLAIALIWFIIKLFMGG